MRIELTSSDWKSEALTVVLYLRGRGTAIQQLWPPMYCAVDRIRTCCIQLGRLALDQMSFYCIGVGNENRTHIFWLVIRSTNRCAIPTFVVGISGFEPLQLELQSSTLPLSYTPNYKQDSLWESYPNSALYCPTYLLKTVDSNHIYPSPTVRTPAWLTILNLLWSRQDLNLWPFPFQGSTLPAELLLHYFVVRVGFEPTTCIGLPLISAECLIRCLFMP